MSDEPGFGPLIPGEDGAAEEARVERALRWRLVLGKYSDAHLSPERLRGMAGAGGGSARLKQQLGELDRLDGALQYIYDREHASRSHRSATPDGPDTVSVPRWLSRVRELFPREAAEVIERDALYRYGVKELVTDPEVLRNAEPSEDLLRAIVEFKHLMGPEALDAARVIVRAVVDRIAERFKRECGPSLFGARSPDPALAQRSARNVDFRKTIRRNLKNFNEERDQIVIDRVFYHARQRRRQSHRVIVAVDQSGSMTDSLIHAAVMAAIFASLPALSVHLVLWDHRVMDVTELLDDPVEVLMSAQLGGGTQLLPAMQYCAGLITQPDRTIFVILSDWYLFGEEKPCLALAQELSENGVKGVGLNALDADCKPIYNEPFAKELAGCGWFVATLTPAQLAEYVSRIVG